MTDVARRVRESMDHRWTVAGVVALLVAVVGFVLWEDGVREAGAARTGGAEAEDVVAEADLTRVPVGAERVPPPDAEADPAEAPVDVPGEDAAGPRDGVSWLVLEVVDELDAPVRAAEVVMDGLRLRDEPSAHYGWVGEESRGVTDRDGRVRLFHPDEIAGEGAVGEVSFHVRHPDFIPYRDTEFDVTEGGGRVVLERGCFVAVSGWIDDAAERVVDVVPRADDASRVRAADWVPLGDGRPATTRMPPGARSLVLSARLESGVYHSDVVDFELAAGEEVELHLELHPAVTIRGRLDEDVPRPVFDGEVTLNFVVGGERSPASGSMGRYRTVPVDLEGGFLVEDAPPGAWVEGIAICDGWVSERGDWTGRNDFPQGFEVGREDVEIELAMQRTVDFEGTFVDRDGAGIVGAKVYFWPNVRWSNHYAQIFMDRSWTGTTDASGRVSVRNVPPWADEFAFEHDAFVLPALVLPDRGDWRNGDRIGLVALRPGEVYEKEYVCEPKDP